MPGVVYPSDWMAVGARAVSDVLSTAGSISQHIYDSILNEQTRKNKILIDTGVSDALRTFSTDTFSDTDPLTGEVKQKTLGDLTPTGLDAALKNRLSTVWGGVGKDENLLPEAKKYLEDYFASVSIPAKDGAFKQYMEAFSRKRIASLSESLDTVAKGPLSLDAKIEFAKTEFEKAVKTNVMYPDVAQEALAKFTEGVQMSEAYTIATRAITQADQSNEQQHAQMVAQFKKVGATDAQIAKIPFHPLDPLAHATEILAATTDYLTPEKRDAILNAALNQYQQKRQEQTAQKKKVNDVADEETASWYFQHPNDPFKFRDYILDPRNGLDARMDRPTQMYWMGVAEGDIRALTSAEAKKPVSNPTALNEVWKVYFNPVSTDDQVSRALQKYRVGRDSSGREVVQIQPDDATEFLSKMGLRKNVMDPRITDQVKRAQAFFTEKKTGVNKDPAKMDTITLEENRIMDAFTKEIEQNGGANLDTMGTIMDNLLKGYRDDPPLKDSDVPKWEGSLTAPTNAASFYRLAQSRGITRASAPNTYLKLDSVSPAFLSSMYGIKSSDILSSSVDEGHDGADGLMIFKIKGADSQDRLYKVMADDSGKKVGVYEWSPKDGGWVPETSLENRFVTERGRIAKATEEIQAGLAKAAADKPITDAITQYFYQQKFSSVKPATEAILKAAAQNMEGATYEMLKSEAEKRKVFFLAPPIGTFVPSPGLNLNTGRR